MTAPVVDRAGWRRAIAQRLGCADLYDVLHARRARRALAKIHRSVTP